MSKRRGSRIVDLHLCPMPVEVINATLETELEPGGVMLGRGAQAHALKRHPDEYPLCLPHVASVVANPLYIGDDFNNEGSIELIGRVPALGGFMLVAVTVTKDQEGFYNVCSFYPVGEKKIQSRRERGFLMVAVAKR